METANLRAFKIFGRTYIFPRLFLFEYSAVILCPLHHYSYRYVRELKLIELYSTFQKEKTKDSE